MSKWLLTVSILAGAAFAADAPVLAVLVFWLGLSGAIAVVFGSAALIGQRPGEDA